MPIKSQIARTSHINKRRREPYYSMHLSFTRESFSHCRDASPIHGPDAVNNSGNTREAELLDDFEVELDNHENTDQRITDDVNITESGDGTTNSEANQRAGLKRRHRLVIDDDDDDE